MHLCRAAVPGPGLHAGAVGEAGPAVPGPGLPMACPWSFYELLRARAAGAGSDIQLPVESMTVELTVTATRSLNGKAGFTMPVACS